MLVLLEKCDGKQCHKFELLQLWENSIPLNFFSRLGFTAGQQFAKYMYSFEKAGILNRTGRSNGRRQRDYYCNLSTKGIAYFRKIASKSGLRLHKSTIGE